MTVYRISDTGCGIAADQLDKIFDPFFSTKLHSFGLGLPLVKQTVTEHIGEIAVESDPGKGTTFSLRFPLRWKQDADVKEKSMQDWH